MRCCTFLIATLAIGPALLLPRSGCADVLVLKSGGKIEGQLVGGDEASTSDYVIESRLGGRITVPRATVERIDRQSDLQEEYNRRVHAQPDTVEAHWKLAEWCREQGFDEESQAHLERILELQPGHEEARQMLGYRAVEGRWLTRDELMASRGMVMYEGRFRTPQEVKLLQRLEQRENVDADWRSQLQRWHRRLFDRQPERVTEAQRQFESIQDPRAAEPLADLLTKEENFDVKLLFIEVLSRLEHQAAFNALVSHALFDPAEEIRMQSLEYLIHSQRPGMAQPFIKALKHRENVIVNRAARALREINDRTAISPLIDALVTEHVFAVGEGSGGGQQYAYSPTSGGFSFGGGGPQAVRRKIKNPDVLSTLIALSGGESFDFDEARWRTWLAAQARRSRVDMRRDQ